MLEKMGYLDRKYEIVHVEHGYSKNDYHNYVTGAISVINESRGDILLRGIKYRGGVFCRKFRKKSCRYIINKKLLIFDYHDV